MVSRGFWILVPAFVSLSFLLGRTLALRLTTLQNFLEPDCPEHPCGPCLLCFEATIPLKVVSRQSPGAPPRNTGQPLIPGAHRLLSHASHSAVCVQNMPLQVASSPSSASSELGDLRPVPSPFPSLASWFVRLTSLNPY